MHRKTVAELARLLHHKEISSVELTQYFLDRIRRYDSRINAFITVTAEEALKAAAYADSQIAKGNIGPLTGIPIAHKDIFCTEDVKTTCGSRMLHDFVSPYDATIVKKLKDAGTVMLGKTNLDEFAMGSSNENSYYGPVRNPWDVARVPGGSSGGSSAAVAARLVLATTGTDTGGSVRQPAAFTGIVGLKPTYGRVSRFGLIAFASSLDQAGVMTLTAEDAALLLTAIAGFDANDFTSVDVPVPNYMTHLEDNLQGLKIGLPKEYFYKGLNPKIVDATMTAAHELEKMGATLHEINLPRTDIGLSAYYVIAPAECSSNLARYDGVCFGYRCKNPKNLEDLYKRSRGEGFGEEVKHRILIGTEVLSSGYYDDYYLRAQKVRRMISDDFQAAFKSVDIILAPTTPTTAFKLGEKIEDRLTMYASDTFTVMVNLAGLTGISIPAGVIEELPIGVQFIGNYFEEAKLLNVAHQYQKVTDWHQKMPKQFG